VNCSSLSLEKSKHESASAHIKFFLKLDLKKSLIYTVIFLTYLLGKSYLNNESMQNANSQLRSDYDGLKIENKDLRSKLGVLGLNTEEYTGQQKNIEDFNRDWDISNFYLKSGDTFCPKHKGDNKYQRMFYKYDTPLTATDFSLKFKMVDEDNKITNYTQRILSGLSFEDEILSEFDIPTRDSQVVNFRVASGNGGLITGGPGKSISSTIKDKSIINLKFRTQFKSTQEITQFIDLDYLSSIDDYGNEKKTINYDSKINDPKPETAKANIFIGSYMWGCIKIIEWKTN